MNSGIYRITCIMNGKVYIGSATNLDRRWQDHRRHLEKNTHPNRYLRNAWNKYGSEAFFWEVLEHVLAEKLIEREQYYIDMFQSSTREYGFNITPTAGSLLGYKASEETRKKQRIAKLGKKNSPEHIAKASAARRGKKLSPEHCARISESHRGKKKSLEQIAKQAEALRGKKHSPEHIARWIESRRGWKHSPESRAKMSESQRGRKDSPERIAKRAATIREVHRRRKAEAARLKAEQQAHATFLRTGIKPEPIKNPSREIQGSLFDE